MKSKRHSTPARAGRALLPSALLIVLLTAAGVWGASPDWSVNPAAYAKQMSVMGALLVDYEAAGPGNRVAAFSGGTCRGVAEPVQIGGTWVYFLTVYGSPGDTSVRFRAYVAAEDAVLEVLETLPFASGAIHGSPFAPFQWNAILRYDYPPEVGDIPGQTIEIGDSFSGVRLDDYLTSQDGDAVTWTGSGGGFLDVLIDGDNVARVVAPAGWLGSETVVFTAVEQTEGGKAGSTAAVFTVRGIDHPPAVSGIGDQRIGPEGAFRSFDLDDHLTEADGDAVAWSYWFVAGDGGQAAPGWSVDPAEYSGSMSVIARAAVRGRWADTQDYLLGAFAGDQCRGVARPMALAGSHVFWMSVYGRPGDGALTFRLYDPVAREVVEVYGSIDYAHGGRSGTPDAPLSLRAGPIVLEIGEGNVVTPILVERGREVSEEIVFEARDTGTLHEFAATAGVRLSYSLLNAPPVAHAGDDIVVPCLSPTATPVTLDGTGSADPDGDPLSFRWLEGGRIIATGARPTVELSLGSHPIALVVNDGQVDSEPDEVVVQVVDVTAPVMVLVGDPTLYLELGTPYAEPGVTAIDACDGDLSQAVTRSGEVNEQVEGTYAISYSVTDAAGNAASLERAVRVVVTPNSYGLVATRSLEIQERATVHSGFVGVLEYGRRPYPPGDAELVAGPRAQTAAGVRVTAPRVRLKNGTSIAGLLVYAELLSVGPQVRIETQQQVGPDHWPLFADFGLPGFRTGEPGHVDVTVGTNRRVELDPAAGPFEEIRVRTRGTLVLTGGEYAIGSLQIDLGATVIVRAPTTLLIADQLGLGHWAYFGPEEGGINAADIRVYVAGRSGHDDRGTTTGMGVYSSFSGNLYAPNGTVRLNQQAKLIGSAIARDVVVGVGADVYLANGWRTPGVVCQTQPLPTARPSVGSPAAGPASVQLLENYPNPFNGSTTIRYELPAAGTVRLAIYNALGQQVRVLVDGPQPEGVHRVEWNGRDAGGFPVSSGAYFSRLESGEGVQVRRMVLVQ